MTVFAKGGAACSAEDAALYLAHVDAGESIRALASVTGTHPSTVMRSIRRVEERRDDPLIDQMLSTLESRSADPARPEEGPTRPAAGLPGTPHQSESEVQKEAKRLLRRLSEPGSFLLMPEGAERGGIFCAANQHRKPIAMVEAALAGVFLRRDWIRIATRGAQSLRYQITDVGRAFLRRCLAEDAEARRKRQGFAEAGGVFRHQHKVVGERLFMDPSGTAERLAVNLGENPLGWLARRKGPDGKPFLSPEEVEAGERLRMDFEMAQMGPSVTQDWRRFLTPSDGGSGAPGRGPCEGPSMARERVAKALSSLGPGLADAVLRVCCFLEGLEACERRMGWAARSGKVVLKIGLERLAEHYGIAPFKH
ncbi:MAG: DUF6456 domain-containing protein [Pseudomonadota bacterium]